MMARQPAKLETGRLLLRPFEMEDAAVVRHLAGDRALADMTLNIPYPYEEGMAEAWIETHPEGFAAGTLANFAITLKEGGDLVGAVGFIRERDHSRAEMGYWIGKPFWGQGYCTEAGEAILRYGFTCLGIHRICAYHFSRNPASGRVMQKLGMQREGMLRQHVMKWDAFEDVVVYGILKKEWEAA